MLAGAAPEQQVSLSASQCSARASCVTRVLASVTLEQIELRGADKQIVPGAYGNKCNPTTVYICCGAGVQEVATLRPHVARTKF